jgi:hypothetical protein
LRRLRAEGGWVSRAGAVAGAVLVTETGGRSPPFSAPERSVENEFRVHGTP